MGLQCRLVRAVRAVRRVTSSKGLRMPARVRLCREVREAAA